MVNKEQKTKNTKQSSTMGDVESKLTLIQMVIIFQKLSMCVAQFFQFFQCFFVQIQMRCFLTCGVRIMLLEVSFAIVGICEPLIENYRGKIFFTHGSI